MQSKKGDLSFKNTLSLTISRQGLIWIGLIHLDQGISHVLEMFYVEACKIYVLCELYMSASEIHMALPKNT